MNWTIFFIIICGLYCFSLVFSLINNYEPRYNFISNLAASIIWSLLFILLLPFIIVPAIWWYISESHENK